MSCYSVKINDGINGEVCTEDRAIEIAENLMNDRNPSVEIQNIYNRSLIITDGLFRIHYFNNDTLRRGGGASLEISKTNCKVVKIEFHQ